MAQKAALVAGGGSGIGKSVCTRFASDGATVFVLDIDRDAAQETTSDIVRTGGQAEAVVCDVANHKQVVDEVGRVLARTELDILVNSAGVAHVGNIENTSEAEFERLYSVNVKGIYNTISAVIPAMKARKRGVIVNVASVASSVGIADRFAYSMTKGAVLTMTYSVAKDYVDFGIRCNCVSPARIHTPFVDNFLAANYPENRDEVFDSLSKSQPIGRMGTAEEVAGLIAYLCSDEASFITGSNYPIDGGFVTLNN